MIPMSERMIWHIENQHKWGLEYEKWHKTYKFAKSHDYNVNVRKQRKKEKQEKEKEKQKISI